MPGSLFNDRIFWLSSSYIEHVDYDVKVANLINTRENQQFKSIVALFNVHGLEFKKEDAQRLLGEQFSLKTMKTKRNLDKNDINSK